MCPFLIAAICVCLKPSLACLHTFTAFKMFFYCFENVLRKFFQTALEPITNSQLQIRQTWPDVFQPRKRVHADEVVIIIIIIIVIMMIKYYHTQSFQTNSFAHQHHHHLFLEFGYATFAIWAMIGFYLRPEQVWCHFQSQQQVGKWPPFDMDKYRGCCCVVYIPHTLIRILCLD